MNQVLIIAEAGVNHNGSLDTAKKLIEVAAASKVDYVKFQTFKTSKLVTKAAVKADYQQANTKTDDSQFEMLQKLELSEQDHYALIEHCKVHNVKFLSTAFDLDSLDFLNKLGMDLFKIPSGEITNLPYLKAIGRLKKKVIVSTGMCFMEEIEEAIGVLVKEGTPKEDITVLHCNTEYPTPYEDVNILAMNAISRKLGVSVGYSDHTQGIEVPIAAVALGATVIEKHFTLDHQMEGPDHLASLEPDDLRNMVSCIRNIEKSLGSEEKKPSNSEVKNIAIARKSIHLSKNLDAGHILTQDDLIMKRPGDGISPMRMDDIIGKKLQNAFPEDYKLDLNDLV
ncbi:N-acetylneuraminate synthase [Pedobacter sp. KBW06]|uniref:N-acetylneuraminate synthase n=1 Tax=Pedobacter sp. KBW06 TaxID=2153359 RepID=UPI000F5AE497|nr:N-acetylneuraminate synthase [Pedobacter sp. KBW06]RQO67582.1 N-acetylneuraminate synthase [Pedobacter sp. KBW06]